MKVENKVRIGGHLFARPKELLKLEARENYTQIYFRNGKEVLVATTIGLLAERLSMYDFYRTDRGALVNLNCVKSLYKDGRKMRAILITNEMMKVSKRRVNALIDLSKKQNIRLEVK